LARPTDYTTGELGALDADANAAIAEDVPFTGQDYYELKQLVAAALAEAEVTDPVIDVAICDAKTCGECGLPSDGCQVMFALTGVTTGSPGLPSELLYSQDGGATWAATSITTLALGEAASAMACVGTNLVVISNASDSLHYAPITDILTGTEVWTEVAVGFVAAGSPNAIFSLGRTKTWIVGDGGYVYFSDDITQGVVVQTDGAVTAQDLQSIHGASSERLAASGAANAFIVTSNGGTTWAAVVGPNVGVLLSVVSFRPDASDDEIWIGDAGGQLWYSLNVGQTWVEKTFPGSGAGTIYDLVWSTHSVGYLSHSTIAPAGRILRTISGGQSWYVLPEAPGINMPANDQVSALAACEEDANLVLGGGIADDGTDGFLVLAA
ncbi:hypothetical protein LCGC14_1382250, partial [marine sediment metagenome]